MSKPILKKKQFIETLTELEDKRSANGLTFYLDQAKFYDRPDFTTRWVLKGQEAIIPTLRIGRQKMIVYGMSSQTISYLHVEEVLEETSEATASLLITLRATFPHRRLDVVLDNARWHYGADGKYVAKEYQIHLH